MVSFTSLAALALAPLAFGRILSITVPVHTVQAGQNISAVIEQQSYIQNWDDFSIIWGLRGESLNTCQTCLGQEVGYTEIFGNEALRNKLGNSTVEVSIPEYITAGDYALVAAVPHLVGASGGVSFSYFNHSLSVTESS